MKEGVTEGKGRTGTAGFMAPEMLRGDFYNEKVWGLLFMKWKRRGEKEEGKRGVVNKRYDYVE